MATGGVTAFLFTDIVSSTEVRERLGDDGFERLRRAHFRLLREAVSAAHGEEVKTLGDGLMVAFPSALAAVTCAVSMQQTVERHNRRRQAPPLFVRIGVHVGEPIKEEGDYFGRPVVVAQRLCASAESGQILCSELVRDLVGSRGDLVFRAIGPVELKGMADALRVCVIEWESVAEDALPIPPALLSVERPPYVGREDQLQELYGYWKRAQGAELEVVFLVGEPGIGKTPLTIEFALGLHREGATVMYGRCDEESAFPYQPFVEALRHHLATCPMEEIWSLPDGSAAELARLVPELVSRLPTLREEPALDGGLPPPAETERYRLFDAVAAVFGAAARDRPVLLVLDDLHWADKTTLLLLRHLVRYAFNVPLLVLGLYRDSELSRTHPLAEALTGLRGERSVRRLVVRPLDEEETIRLVEAAAPDRLPSGIAALARRLHHETEGNPFFLQEILRHLDETEPFSGFRPLGLPESVADVLGRRLSRLGEEANRVLSVGAVIGREFDLDLLRLVSELSEDEVVDVIDEAVRHRVLLELPGATDRFAFSHGLVRETLYKELTTTRRLRLHRRVGQVLEELHAGDLEPHLGELAYHYAESATIGGPDRAVAYAMAAADRAMAQLAYEEAARLYELAVQSIELKEPPVLLESWEVLRRLRAAQVAAGDLDAARTCSRRLLDIARSSGDDRWLAEARADVADIEAREAPSDLSS